MSIGQKNYSGMTIVPICCQNYQVYLNFLTKIPLFSKFPPRYLTPVIILQVNAILEQSPLITFTGKKSEEASQDLYKNCLFRSDL